MKDEMSSKDLTWAVFTSVMKGLSVIFIIIILFGSFYIISAGERGILLTFGKADVLAKTEGLHFKFPLVQKIIKMDVKTQKYVVEKASAASSDLQTVTTDVAVNFYITPDTVPNLYTKVGLDYESKVIQPAVYESVKAITAKFSAEQLITKREEVKAEIESMLRERLKVFDINLQTISITNFDFSASFNSAIEAKVTAEQNALAAKNKLAQVEYEAQQRITQAEGEAKAIQIQVQAINAQGGENYVQLQSIQKWDGVLPLVTGSGSMPFINIATITNSTK